jgi:hypothetical protein
MSNRSPRIPYEQLHIWSSIAILILMLLMWSVLLGAPVI